MSTVLLSDPPRPAWTPVVLPATERPGAITRPPVPLTSLIGRERELAEAVAFLRGAGSSDGAGTRGTFGPRLVTLTGPGGVGKTRLALAVAAAVAEDFADGVVFVALGSLTDPALVLPTIAQALGVAEAGDRPVAGGLIAHLRDRSLLLLLDNVEQVAAAAPAVVALLAGAPAVKVLATSRAPLRVSVERMLPVSPLALPTDSGGAVGQPRSLAELGEVAAIQLFATRARAARGGFALSEENARRGGDDLRAAGWAAAGDRAGGGADQDPAAGGDRGAAGETAAAADGRSARSAGSPADDARRDRLELRPAHRRGAGSVSPPLGVQRRVLARGGGGGRSRRR